MSVLMRLLSLMAVFVLAGCSQGEKHTREESVNQGEEFYRKGTELLEANPEKAIEYLTRSLNVCPNSPPALYNRAAAYARTGRDSEAAADVRRLETLNPLLGQQLRKEFAAAAIPYVDIGNSLCEAGKLDEALKKYEAAIIYDPSCANGWVGKGIVLKKRAEAEQALTCYNRALELDPNNYFGYINRAELHHSQKRLRQALADYTKAIELRPTAPEPYAERAVVYSDLQLPVDAARDKETAKRLSAGKHDE